MDYSERVSHTRSVYLTQYTSRTGTVRVKQEEDENNSKRVVRNMEERNVGTKRKNFRQGLARMHNIALDIQGNI